MSIDPTEGLRRFVAELEHALGADLQSVVLFGSIPRGEARPDVSDVNLLVLLRRLDRATLAKGAPVAQRWREEAGAVPLLFSPDEWRRAADVFPIEIADMRDHRRVLLGMDPVAGLEVSPANLRPQLEREVRGKLAQLRRGVFLAADRPSDLGRLLLGVAPSVASYLRGLLRLAGEPVPASTPDTGRQACALLRAAPEPFLDLWAGREKPEAFQPSGDCMDGVFDLLLKTAAYVDTWEGR